MCNCMFVYMCVCVDMCVYLRCTIYKIVMHQYHSLATATDTFRQKMADTNSIPILWYRIEGNFGGCKFWQIRYKNTVDME